MFVYEVQMDQAQVDINTHAPGSIESITSVMSGGGTVVGVAGTVATVDCRKPIVQGISITQRQAVMESTRLTVLEWVNSSGCFLGAGICPPIS